MAIPLSNEMKEVRAPRTAEIMPMDNQRLIEGMGQMALGMNRQMQDTARGAFKAGQQGRDQQDAFKRNEAERIYNERTTELNTQLAQKEGEERVKFQPKYEAEMKLASDTYEAAINKVHNFDIREGSKRSINAWNNRNASNYQYENYKNESELQEKSAAQALVASNRRRLEVVSPAQTLESLQAMLSDDTDNGFGFKHEEDIIRQFYGGRKGEPEEVVEQRIKDYKSKALIAMANRYNQQTMALDGYTGYKVGTGLLEWGQANNLINSEEATNAKREMQTERLDACFKMHPEDFVKNGRYNIEWAREIAKDLTVDELLKSIGKASNGSGLGAGAQVALDELSLKRNREFYNQFLSDGMGFLAGSVPQAYRDEFVNEANIDYIGSQEKARRNSFSSITKAVNYIAKIDSLLQNNRIAIAADGSSVEVNDSKPGSRENELKAKGYKIATLGQQDELLKTRNMLIAHLEHQNHTGALDRMARGDNFLRRYIPGFQKKLSNSEAQILKQVRATFNNVRPKAIRGWDPEAGFGPISMFTGPIKAINRIRKYGWNWQLDSKSLPMATQFDTQMANTYMALSQAAQITGVSLDDIASETGNTPVQPKVKQIQIVNGEKKEVIAEDQKSAPITFNDAFSYYLAAQTVDTQGDDFMRALTNSDMPEAAKIAAFKHEKLSEGFDTEKQTYTYSNSINRTFASLNPIGNLYNAAGGKNPYISSMLGVMPNVSNQSIAAVAATIKAAAKKTFTKDEAANPVLQPNNPLASIAYDLEDGDAPGEPKSYQQLMADRKVFSQDDAMAYITRRDNDFYADKMITDEELAEPNSDLRIFYVEDHDMQSVLQNRAMTYSLGLPEDASTREITLDQVANSATEMMVPEEPTVHMAKKPSDNKNNFSVINNKVVFLTPEGYNYLWSNNFLGGFESEPQRFNALLGARKKMVSENRDNTANGKSIEDDPNKTSFKSLPEVPLYLTIPDKDKPFDFR